MKKKFLISLLATLIPFYSVHAEDNQAKTDKVSQKKASYFSFSLSNAYIGAGRGAYYLDEDGYKSSAGFQLYAGYAFSKKFFKKLSLAAELGYMDSGKFDAKPVIINNTIVTPESVTQSNTWVSAVANYPLHGKWGVHGRLGYDFGDNSGALYGGGVTYQLHKHFDIMAEAVARDILSSGQVNLVYHF